VCPFPAYSHRKTFIGKRAYQKMPGTSLKQGKGQPHQSERFKLPVNSFRLEDDEKVF
jgi:hypothetical protein